MFRTFETDGICIANISDTRGGIDEKTLPKIFDPFFYDKGKGAGLDFSVAHEIAMRHNGQLTATNRYGRADGLNCHYS